jgi:hypothetical protein
MSFVCRNTVWRNGVTIFLMAYVAAGLALPNATAQNAGFAQALYGMWYTYPLGNPNTDNMRHEFRHNPATGKDEMIVTRLCPEDYRAVIARAVAPIEISDNKIHVLKKSSDSEKMTGNAVCQVSIEAGVIGYTISNEKDRITLTNPGGNPDLLQLARQDAASESVLPASLYGSWLMPVQPVSGGASVQIRLVFYNSADNGRGKVREISACSKDNNSLVAQVDSDITVAQDRLTILKSVSQEEESGPFTCTASITAGTLRFVVSPSGTTMTLAKPGGAPITLTRDRKGLN